MWRRWEPVRDELRQFPQVLGCGGQQELVFGSAWATEAQTVEHCFSRANFRLSNSARRLDIHNHRMLQIDEVVDRA